MLLDLMSSINYQFCKSFSHFLHFQEHRHQLGNSSLLVSSFHLMRIQQLGPPFTSLFKILVLPQLILWVMEQRQSPRLVLISSPKMKSKGWCAGATHIGIFSPSWKVLLRKTKVFQTIFLLHISNTHVNNVTSRQFGNCIWLVINSQCICREKREISAGAYGGHRSQVCARLTLRSASHQPKRNFVCPHFRRF